MDMITTLIVCGVVMFFLFTICGWCCRSSKPEASFVSVAVPVVGAVPVQPHGPNPPYPVQQTIMPQPMQGHQMPALPIGFSAYPQTPYPPPGTRDFNPPAAYPPYPGYPPHASAGPMQQNPPTYDEATTGSQAYPKQSPFNPNYK